MQKIATDELRAVSGIRRPDDTRRGRFLVAFLRLAISIHDRFERGSGFHVASLFGRAFTIDALRILQQPDARPTQPSGLGLANIPQRCGRFQVGAGPLRHGCQLSGNRRTLPLRVVAAHDVLLKEIVPRSSV